MKTKSNGVKPGLNTSKKANFKAGYEKLIADRAATEFDLLPRNQAIGYTQIPGTNFCESALKIRLDVAELRGSSIAWTVAEKLASATTPEEAQDAICYGMFDLKRIPNFDRACASFVMAFMTAYEVNMQDGEVSE